MALPTCLEDIDAQIAGFAGTLEVFHQLVAFNTRLIQFRQTLPTEGPVAVPMPVRNQLQALQKRLLLETAQLQNRHRQTRESLLRTSVVRILEVGRVAVGGSEQEEAEVERLVSLYQTYLSEIQEYQELIFRNNEVQTALERSNKSVARLQTEVTFEFSDEVFEIIRHLIDADTSLEQDAIDLETKTVNIHRLTYDQFVAFARHEKRFRTKQGVINDHLLSTRKRLKVSNGKWLSSFNELAKHTRKVTDKFKAVRKVRTAMEREQGYNDDLYGYYDDEDEDADEEEKEKREEFQTIEEEEGNERDSRADQLGASDQESGCDFNDGEGSAAGGECVVKGAEGAESDYGTLVTGLSGLSGPMLAMPVTNSEGATPAPLIESEDVAMEV